MASRKTDSKSDPDLAAAAEKASMVIRGLQARLHQRAPERALETTDETADELENQLAQYFQRSVPTSRQPILSDVRNSVIDAVAERILREWEQNSPIEGAVIERLIERVLDRFGHTLP